MTTVEVQMISLIFLFQKFSYIYIYIYIEREREREYFMERNSLNDLQISNRLLLFNHAQI